MPPALAALIAQPVVIVAGKGGVGKTTVTATLAFAGAAAGLRVLVVDLDGKGQLGALVDGAVFDGDGTVDVATISAGGALNEYLADHGFGRMARRLSNSGVIDLVAAATPGINDVVVLGKIKQIANSGAYDTVIVDGPAAGHALTMLTSARGLIEVARGGPVRRQAEQVDALLTDKQRCGVVLVTLAETTPVSELVETAFSVEEHAEVALNGVVVNALWGAPRDTATAFAELPPRPDATDAVLDGDDALGFIAGRHRVQREALTRLAEELPLAAVAMPLVASAAMTGDDVASLARATFGGESEQRSWWLGDHRVPAVIGAAPDTDAVDAGADGDVSGFQTATGGIARVVEKRSVLLCVGSGGVGKTTVAAALGWGAARRGRRAIVVTIDPARRLAEAIGMPDGIADVPTQIDVGDEPGALWAMMLDPDKMLRRVVQQYASDDDQVERIVGHRLFRQLASGLSGTQEYMATEALYELSTDERFDLVIVDTPPSRQTLTFLESPGVLSRFLSHRLFRLMMLPTRGGFRFVNDAGQALLRQVGKTIGTDVLADATAFFQAFAGMEDGFRRRAQSVGQVLHAPTTGFVLAAGPNADTVTEARWFRRRLEELGAPIAATVVNRIMPMPSPQSISQSNVAAGEAEQLAVMAAVASAQRANLAPLIGGATDSRTGRVAVDPMVIVPLRADDVHDAEMLRQIGDVLYG